MKKSMRDCIISFMALIVLITISSCAAGRGLKTEEIRAGTISGTFTVILYGGRFSGDLENVAILDIEGDRYKFEVFAPDFDYRIKTGVPAQEAIKIAERFIAFHGSFKYSQISQIKDMDGKVIGYEFRPLYSASEFGFFNVLEIDYWLKDNTVITKIDLIPELKRQRYFDDKNNDSE